MLTPDDRHRHVRRFKVSRAITDDERRKKGFSRQEEEAYDEEDEENDNASSNLRHYFDTHNFCRPSENCLQSSRGGSITDHPEAWVPLSDFISQLSGL